MRKQYIQPIFEATDLHPATFMLVTLSPGGPGSGGMDAPQRRGIEVP